MTQVPFSPPSVVESALSETDAGYVAQVRDAVRRLGRRPAGDAALADALEDLGVVAAIDADIPVRSPRPLLRRVKQVVKALVGWYLRYLAAQTTALGQATVRLGSALAERIDGLDAADESLRVDVARLGRRVDELEERSGPR